MSTLSIFQLNWKKVSPLGLSLIFSDLTLTVLTDSLRNAIDCRWLTSKTKFIILCMTLTASYWEVNVLMGTLQAMRGVRSVTQCNVRRP